MNADFKFQEARNLAAFTTRQVIDGAPILFVYHDEDGDWQFHNSDSPDVKDVKIISLEHVVRLDPSVNELSDLDYGWYAWRESTAHDWQRAADDSED